MKHSVLRTMLSFVFAACVLSLSLAVHAAGDDVRVYINNSYTTEAFDSLYAVGEGNHTEQLTDGTLYALTADGIVRVGSGEQFGDAPEGDAEPDVSPELEPSPTATAAPSEEPVATPEPEYEDVPVAYSTVKVGLHYGSTAVSEAALSNEVGSGFAFGYFDNDRVFHEVARTDANNITLIPDWNWTMEDGRVFGCYHILPHGSFTTFEEAKAEADRLGGFPIYYSGSYFVMVGSYWNPDEAEAAKQTMGISGDVLSGSRYCVVVTETGTERILFEYDCGSASSLAIRPISDEEQAITVYNGLRYYGDFQFARLSGDQFMTAVNYVDIEDYTKCVIPYEMYVSWPQAALEAQAMCARNYVATSFNRYRAQGFDVTADIYSQVYKGMGDTTPETNAAVDASAGKYIRYRGELCQTFFFSSDGGATESSENVWGIEVPYLVGVEDPYEADVETYSKEWTYSCTPEEVQTMVNERESVELDVIADIDCSYTLMGNMKSITFTDINGKTHTVSGNRCNYVMGTKSQRFQITEAEDGSFVVLGSGWGHNCGMSQYGAYSMAKLHGKTAEEIIKFYYTGVYIR